MFPALARLPACWLVSQAARRMVMSLLRTPAPAAPPRRMQVQSQSFTGANAAIRACMEHGKPLRVCRASYVDTT